MSDIGAHESSATVDMVSPTPRREREIQRILPNLLEKTTSLGVTFQSKFEYELPQIAQAAMVGYVLMSEVRYLAEANNLEDISQVVQKMEKEGKSINVTLSSITAESLKAVLQDLISTAQIEERLAHSTTAPTQDVPPTTNQQSFLSFKSKSPGTRLSEFLLGLISHPEENPQTQQETKSDSAKYIPHFQEIINSDVTRPMHIGTIYDLNKNFLNILTTYGQTDLTVLQAIVQNSIHEKWAQQPTASPVPEVSQAA